jgi:alpha-L-fucosidase
LNPETQSIASLRYLIENIYISLTNRNRLVKIVVFCFFILTGLAAFGQPAPKPYGPLPTERQLRWQETEMYCIIHFGPDTYTDKEWGYGDEDPRIVNPAEFSAMQIVGAAKAGGFKGIVVVAKHHDGFCLWPTKTTEHNISKSPYKNGKGDLLQEYRDACNKLDMKMGVYCSPWDRNSAMYGKPEYVTEVYRNQLEELYTHYGPIFISWFDGANGGDGYYGGAREVRKIDRSAYYGWPITWAIPRKLQPGAVSFGDVGPDVRWVGNERGTPAKPVGKPTRRMHRMQERSPEMDIPKTMKAPKASAMANTGCRPNVMWR